MEKNIDKLHYYRSYASVNLASIRNNFDKLKALLAPETKTMAVVKADGYGHGAVAVAKTLEGRADYFAVADISEAKELRANGIKTPILILSYTSPYQYREMVEFDITATVYSFADAKAISETAVKLGKNAVIHIAVDTGMSRVGFKDCKESAEIVKEISLLDNVVIEGLFSHYACADCADKSSALTQKKRFDDFIALLEEIGISVPLKHICNSAGVIDLDDHYDMVRLGISIYGLYPSNELNRATLDLEPAMEVVSHIIHIKEIDEGTPVGYGHTYVAPSKRRVATVCIGYADGYQRALSNKGIVLVRGKRAPVIGRVCMDQIMVDITDIDGAHVGDFVVIMGKNGDEFISAEELGELAGSFNYEMICTLMPRVIRTYTDTDNE
ncbi:MAG: alanine racemase [Clostridia bacterium]|nr:alanine racemase [Clostridia bacterium]